MLGPFSLYLIFRHEDSDVGAFGKKVGRLREMRLVRFCLVVDWDCTLDCTWVYVFKRIETAPKELVERWERKFLPPVFFFPFLWSFSAQAKAKRVWYDYGTTIRLRELPLEPSCLPLVRFYLCLR